MQNEVISEKGDEFAFMIKCCVNGMKNQVNLFRCAQLMLSSWYFVPGNASNLC